MGRSKEEPHPAEPLIHAFAAGELDPAHKAAVSKHLETCASCRVVKRRVDSLREIIARSRTEGFDELAWRRISQGVMAHLEAEARSPRGMIGPDGARGSWRLAALVAAGVVGLLVWFAPRPTRVRAPPPVVVRTPTEAPTLSTLETPFQVLLPHGLILSLGPETRIRAPSLLPTDVQLALEVGELSVRGPNLADLNAPTRVITPGFSVVAWSSDFTVGYHATESFVAVREGWADVGGTLGEAEVRAGERRVFSREPGATSDDRPRAEPSRAASERAARDQPSGEEREKSARLREEREARALLPNGRREEQSADGDDERTPAALLIDESESTPATPTDEAKVERMSIEGETRVRVVAPPIDAWAERWRAASDAYYRDRDLDRAIEIARDIAENAGARGETALARDLLCEAYVATSQSAKAVEACTLLLDGAQGEAGRAIHYKLATIYRAQLADCARAIPHYTQSMVFGRASMLDDEAALWRAHCEIEVGDLAAARWDIAALEKRAATLGRPEALIELKKRLAEVSGK